MANVAEYILKFRDGYSAQMGRANRMLKTQGVMIDANTRKSMLFGRALRTALGPISLIFSGGLIVREVGMLTAALQESQVAMGSLYRLDDEGSKQLVDNLRLHAETVPITTKEYIKYSKMLASVGVEQNNLIPIMDRLGDIGLAVGREKLPFIVKAYRDVVAAGRLYGQEVRQFRDNAIDIIGELADMYGLTREQAKKLQEQQAFTSKDVTMALDRMTGAGGRFHDFMKKMSAESITGKFAILVGKLQNMAFEFANSATPSVLAMFDKMIYLVDAARSGQFDTFGAAFMETLRLIQSVGNAFIKPFQALTGEEGGVLTFLSKTMSVIALIIQQIRTGVEVATANIVHMFTVATALGKEFFGGSTSDAINTIRESRATREKTIHEIMENNRVEIIDLYNQFRAIRDFKAGGASGNERDDINLGNFDERGGGQKGGAAAKSSSVRGLGASASQRDINITIGQLKNADNIEFNTVNMKENRGELLAMLRELVITAVNDVNYSAG